ncbi:MAG: NINE protein [Candidatus Methylacidiphilales bacterium]|nr:NINE protein [Candidatus Methylacidiphilales bacterium]
MYYLRWGNTQSGPYESHQILQLAEQGMVNNLHEVVDSITSYSMTVQDFKELMKSGKKLAVMDLNERDQERQRIEQLQAQHDEIERLKRENEKYAQQIRTISVSMADQVRTVPAVMPLVIPQQRPVYVMPPAPPRPQVQVVHHYPQPQVMVHHYHQPQPYPTTYTDGHKKSRAVYILLAFFFGVFGVHNFYAGRRKAGMIQIFCLAFFSILAIPFLWIFNIVEIMAVDKDGDGKPMI